MGEYVSLSIDYLNVLTYKNRIGDLLLVFSESDYHTEMVEEDGYFGTRRFYSASVEAVRRRLDVLGYTIKRAQIVFDNQKKAACDWFDYDEEYMRWYESEYSFVQWEKAIQKIAKEEARLKTRSLFWQNMDVAPDRTFAEKVIIKSMSEEGESFWGIFVDWYVDPQKYDEVGWLALRVILDGFNKSKEVVVDYTNLYEGGWCNESLNDELNRSPKTIILTEGKYDISVLSRTIGILYPGMEKYFSFFDFETFRTKGSSDSVVSYIKAFASAQIENRIIAVLDNDAAGIEAKKLLDEINLPKNIRIMTLPNLKFAEKYPTVGPTREEKVNVNGRACSIEMYLGRDVLCADGVYEPVMWEAYREKVQRYQGRLINKSIIQERFENKLKYAIDEGIKGENDWAELRLVFEQIFQAFLE